MEKNYEDIKWPKEFPLNENECENDLSYQLARKIWVDILDKLPTIDADNVDRVVKNAYNDIKDDLINDVIYDTSEAVMKVMKKNGVL